MMTDSKIPPIHPEDVKAGLRKKGSSLSQIARALGVDRSAVSRALLGMGRSRRIEAEIARQLGVEPSKIWPKHW